MPKFKCDILSNFQTMWSEKEWMRGLFFPFSCCYVVILVWSLILSGIIREALVLREEHWPPFPQPPRKLLDISQDNRRILDCLSFLVEKKEEKKRKKVTYFYSPSIPSLFSFGPIWHRVIEVVCCSILHALPRKKSKKKPRAIPDSGNWESSFRTSKAWDMSQTR